MEHDFWDRLIDWVWPVAVLASVLWFLGVTGFQVLSWLQTATWLPLPSSLLFVYLEVDLSPVYSPR